MEWPKNNISFALIISALLIAGYGGEVRARETIKFGCAISFTGKNNINGKRYVDSYNLAKETINKKGGVKVGDKQYPIEIIYYDDKSDAAENKKLMEKLIREDNVDFLLGPYSSEITLSAAAVANEYKVPMVQGGGASRDIFNEKNKYVFGLLPPADQYFQTTLEMMTTFHPKPERIAVIFEDDLFHTQVAEGAKKTAKAIGLNISMYDKILSSSSDFSGILEKIKPISPDVLLISCHTASSVSLIQEVRKQDVGLKMISMTVVASETGFKEALGQDSEYFFCVSSWSSGINFRGVIFKDTNGFIDMFKKTYGYDPDYHNASAVAVLSTFTHAIENAGSCDSETVRDAIAGTDGLETVYGIVTFRPDGQIKGGNLVLQVQDGKLHQVYPKSIKVPVYPIPNWKNPQQ